MARLAATLVLAATAVVGVGAETFVAANDPRVQYSGRTAINADGSRTFDWEAVSISLVVSSTTYVKAVIASTGRTRFIVDEPASSFSAKNYSNGFIVGTFWVDGIAGNLSNNVYYAASGLDADITYTIRVFNDLEPTFHGTEGGPGYGTGNFTFQGFYIDGVAFAAPQPLARSLEWVGDSLTAGFGAHGVHPPCETNQVTSTNYNSYARMVCEELNANCSVIAWSGKGMKWNCCNDTGETMPQYFLQTLGQGQYTSDWDFGRFTPDALVINLGTNDMGSYNGTQAWVDAFEAAYADFVVTATRDLYKQPAMPVLLVQGPFNSSVLWTALNDLVGTLQAQGVNAHYVSAVVAGTPDGCSGHPGTTMLPQMAATMLPQVQAILGWD